MRVIALDPQGAWIAESRLEKGILQSITREEKASEDDFLHYPVLCEGFYDSHMHPSWIAKLKSQILCQNKSKDQIVETLQNSKIQNIYGYGWDESHLNCTLEDFAQSLNALNLDIVLVRVCGHMAYVSPLAKKRFNIPTTSSYLKDEELEAVERPQLNKQSLQLALEEIQRFGINPCADLFVKSADLKILQETAPDMLLFADVKKFEDFPAPNKELRYMKYFLDGSFGAKTAWLREKYSDENTYGRQLWTDDELESSIKKSLSAGYLVAFHAIGDAALDQLLRIGEKLSSKLNATIQNNFFHRIEHLQLCHDDQIEKLQKQKFWSLGLQPSHRVCDLPFSLSRLGTERIKKAYRLKSFLDAGLRISIGSDAPIAPLDPLANFHAILSDPRPEEKLPLSKIYELYCVSGRQNAGIPAKNLVVGTKAWLSTLSL